MQITAFLLSVSAGSIAILHATGAAAQSAGGSSTLLPSASPSSSQTSTSSLSYDDEIDAFLSDTMPDGYTYTYSSHHSTASTGASTPIKATSTGVGSSSSSDKNVSAGDTTMLKTETGVSRSSSPTSTILSATTDHSPFISPSPSIFGSGDDAFGAGRMRIGVLLAVIVGCLLA